MKRGFFKQNHEILFEDRTNEMISVNTENSDSNFFSNQFVDLKVLTEPVNLWRNLNGNNLLEMMYQDPSRWAFAFHSYVQLTMLENHIKICQPLNDTELFNKSFKNNKSENIKTYSNKDSVFSINIMERSLYTTKYCFLENVLKA